MAVVLVLNDERTMLDVYKAVLSELGHEAITKTSVSSGPETVRDVGAQALLVDLMRPSEDAFGLRIIEEVRRDPELHELPVILCTAAPEEVQPLLGRLEQLDVPVLIKPFEVAQLDQVLRGALGEDETAV
jgi:CheY-like chemotaxis protein